MPKKRLDEEGLDRIADLPEFPQVRDGLGRTMMSINPRIEKASPIAVSYAEYRDPSLETFRRGISHWQRFNSIYRQVASLKRKWPMRTAPELLTGILLHQRNVSFQEQLSVLGGKLREGGGVIDFFIPNTGLALNVHGEYYHRNANVETEWLGLIGQSVNGMRINSYRYVFDRDLYRYEDGLAIDYVLAGIQMK